MPESMLLTISEQNSGDRLDAALSDMLAEFSRSRLQKLIKDKQVTVNGEFSKVSKILKDGDVVEISLPDPQMLDIQPQNIPINIVFQDASLLVINKQQGLTVHPASGSFTDTLVNALLCHVKDLSGINGVLRPGIVHRLDKDTSGLMVVAKTDAAHVSLAKQIGDKVCKREYAALLEGVIKTDNGIVEQPVGRCKSDRKKMDIVPDGRYAKTAYFVEKRFENYTLARFELFTGRTHQIRVHAKFLGHPVVGDKVYGFKAQKFALDGQLLHSKRLGFYHPVSGEWMQFESELPDYFSRVLKNLR